MTGLSKPYQAMVIEPSTHSARLMMTLLNQCGIKNIVFASGKDDAIDMLAHSKVDVVICDWSGKDDDGIGVLQAIRNPDGPFDAKLPVIMMSADANVAKVTQARDAGSNEFLAKPISVKNLMKALWSALEKGRPFVESDHFFGPDRRRRRVDVSNPRRANDHDGKDRRRA